MEMDRQRKDDGAGEEMGRHPSNRPTDPKCNSAKVSGGRDPTTRRDGTRGKGRETSRPRT